MSETPKLPRKRVKIGKWPWFAGSVALLAVFFVWSGPPKEKPFPAIPSGMVLVPAGEFFMGCNEEADKACSSDEKPGRSVFLDAFAIDKTEVTVAEYRQCVEAGKCTSTGLTMPYWDGKEHAESASFCNWDKSDGAQHPINCVDWMQADAYCRWAGKRLPTEAEWEKAARGTDKRVYPWGNEWDATKANAIPRGTVPVGSFPTGASPFGVLDLSGNVWEWTADWYDSAYYQNGPTQNPSGPGTGIFRSVRGGSWYAALSAVARV